MSTTETEKSNKESNELFSYYPTDILSEFNKNRHVQILVKAQKDMAASLDELLAKIEKTGTDLKELLDKKTDTTIDNDRIMSLKNRTSKLIKAETIWGCALPLPNELNDNQAHSWSVSEGFVSNSSKVVSKALTGIPKFGKLASAGMNNISELASAAGFRKPMVHPGYFQDYSGTNPRRATFTWDFVPNNVNEAKNIVKIIYALKKFSLPTTTVNGVSMLSPFLYEIKIGNPVIDALMNLNNVVCTNISINYSTEHALQMFSDGIPKHMTLQMEFEERTTVTAEMY